MQFRDSGNNAMRPPKASEVLRTCAVVIVNCTLAISANVAHATLIIDFESLELGELEGQGSWLAPIGRNEFEVVPTSPSGGYEGGYAVRPNGVRDALVDERNLTTIGPQREAIATFQFGSPLQYHSDQEITVSFDVLFSPPSSVNGPPSVWVWLSDSTTPQNASPAYGIWTAGVYTDRYNNGRAYRHEYARYIDVQPGDWLRLFMILDPREQRVRFRENNLTTGEIDRRTVEGFDGGWRYLTSSGAPPFNPTTWDRVNIGFRHGVGVLIDNVSVPTPVPEPNSGMSLVLSGGIIGLLYSGVQRRTAKSRFLTLSSPTIRPRSEHLSRPRK